MKFARLKLEAASPLIVSRLREAILSLYRVNRILVVVESASWFTNSFGIGRAMRAVDEADFGFAVTRITLAVRDASSPTRHPVAESDRLVLPTYTGFRFDMLEPSGSKTLDQYDQVWCFGINPTNTWLQDDSGITRPEMNAVRPEEVQALRAWMDAGGGVFATGDHDVLGASIGHFLPRVRRMRKWTAGEGAPPVGDTAFNDNPGDTRDRIDTTRPHLAQEVPGVGNPSPDVIELSRQSDTTVQRIEWVPSGSYVAGVFRYSTPHALLCHPTLGPIDVMPDHAHEGLCFDEHEFADPDSEFPGGSRPQIIAYGHTLPSPPHVFEKGAQPARRFPMISAYDGQAHAVGRVVVDSTWHHWMDINVDAIAMANTTDWQKISRYYVNLATWLARPRWRTWIFESALVALPYTYYGVQEISPKFSDAVLGQRLVDYLKPLVGPCWVRELAIDILELEPLLVEVLRDRVRPDPCLTCPPFDRLVESMFGAVLRQRLTDGTPLSRALPDPKAPLPRISDEELLADYAQHASRGLLQLTDTWERSLQRTRGVLEAIRTASRSGC
jgi:hypothetical protein